MEVDGRSHELPPDRFNLPWAVECPGSAAPTKELAAVQVGKKRIGPAFAARLAKAVRF